MTSTSTRASTSLEKRELIEKFLGQPSKLPEALRSRIQSAWNGDSVQLYALADLDQAMRLEQTWVALGPRNLAIASTGPVAEPPVIRSFERSRITAVRKLPGLSCTTVTFLGAPGEPALATLRYTHRQQKAMENLLYVLELQLKESKEPSADGAARTGWQAAVVSVDADEAYSEGVAKAVREAQASVSGNKLAVVWRLTAYMRPYRWRLIAGMSAATLMTLLSLLPPFLTGYLIDRVVKPFHTGALSQEAALSVGWLLIAGIGAVFLIREACTWVRLRTMAILGSCVLSDLRRDLYEHLQELSLSFYSRKKTGSLISRFTELDQIWEFIAFGAVDASLAFITLLGLGLVLVVLDWRLGLLTLFPIPLFMWAIYRYGERMYRMNLRAWRKWSHLMDQLSDTIPGIRVVKVFHQEAQEKQRFDERNRLAVREFLGIHSAWTTFWPLLILGIQGMVLLVWIAAMPRVLSSPESATSLSMGTFISFLLYLGMFFQPIEVLGLMARMLNRAAASAHRTFEILDTRPEIGNVEEPVRLEPVRGRVAFENVSFAYDGVRQILKGLNFEVTPGEMIGLVGPSGAGKTTIVNLLVRFFDVSAGRILVDGVDLRTLETGHFRRQVGMVLQDPYLFHGTILENIRYGMPETGLEQVVEAARAANAHDFICKLPHGYETIVGERGHTLSGGERQRISIARAVLTDPRILILDEATSSVDTETERKIQDALDRLIKGRTVFAIAHRLSTLQRAQRLFVLEDGRITEQGTHAQLLEKEGGTYRKLHRLQQELHEMYAV